MKRPNVDSAEIAQFDAHADAWWDPDGPFAPLHAINPLRLGYIKQHCPVLKGVQTLDVGCGGGLLAEALATEGAQVTGIDLAENSLAVAQEHANDRQMDITYQCISAEALAQKHAAAWDILTCLEMLEHVPNPSSVIEACAQLVKPGGKLFFSTLNRTSKAWVHAIFGAEYLLRLLPRGTHDHAAFITPAELDSWARRAGLQLLNMTGLHYQPLSREYTLGEGVDVNYLCVYQKVAD